MSEPEIESAHQPRKNIQPKISGDDDAEESTPKVNYTEIN